MVLSLDIDGILYPYHEALYTYYEYEMGYSDTYEQFWSSFFPNLSQEKIEYIISIPIVYEMIEPYKHVLEFLEFAASKTNIYYMTSRSLDLERITRKYFKKYNFPFQDNLIMTKDKANSCRLYGVTHFLDDHAHHVESVAKVADAYLMAKIWNREYQDKFNTVHSLREFRERVFGNGTKENGGGRLYRP
jgi:uncharacterized HAD superfamily protein